jgi:hypothetical protein
VLGGRGYARESSQGLQPTSACPPPQGRGTQPHSIPPQSRLLQGLTAHCVMTGLRFNLGPLSLLVPLLNPPTAGSFCSALKPPPLGNTPLNTACGHSAMSHGLTVFRVLSPLGIFSFICFTFGSECPVPEGRSHLSVLLMVVFLTSNHT